MRVGGNRDKVIIREYHCVLLFTLLFIRERENVKKKKLGSNHQKK